MLAFRGNAMRMSRKTNRFFSTPLKTASLAHTTSFNLMKLGYMAGLTFGLGFLYSTLNKDVVADDGMQFTAKKMSDEESRLEVHRRKQHESRYVSIMRKLF